MRSPKLADGIGSVCVYSSAFHLLSLSQSRSLTVRKRDMVKVAIAATGAASALLSLPGKTQAANLIVNGGFEEPAISPNSFRFFRVIPGWRLEVGSSIEINNNESQVGVPFEGNQNIELDSDGVSSIFQEIATTPGQRYTLQFAYSPRPFFTGENILNVTWNGERINTISARGDGLTNTEFTVYSYEVEATDTISFLQFDNLDELSDTVGSLLDAVSLTEIDPDAQEFSFDLTGELGNVTGDFNGITDLNNTRFEASFSYASDTPDLDSDPNRGVFLLEDFNLDLFDDEGLFASLEFEDMISQAFLELDSYIVRVRPARVNRRRPRANSTNRISSLAFAAESNNSFNSFSLLAVNDSCSAFSDMPTFVGLDLVYDIDFDNPNVVPTSAPTGNPTSATFSLFNEFTPLGSTESRPCETAYDTIVFENAAITPGGTTPPPPPPESVPEPGAAAGLGLLGLGWVAKRKRSDA